MTEQLVPSPTHFDSRRQRIVNLDTDVCDLETWLTSDADRYSCARHASGFLVFLPRDEIAASDEYHDDDPYTVRSNITSAFHQRRFTTTLQLIEDCAAPGPLRILDLGCGEGHLTGEIKKRFPSAEVHGLDYSMAAVDFAVGEFPDIEFVLADGLNPPYPPDYLDVVICNNIWEHVPDPLRLLEGITRILKPGGVVVISTPSRFRFGNVLRILVGQAPKLVSTLHVTEYTVGQVHEQLRFGGYEIVHSGSPPIAEGNVVLTAVKAGFRSVVRLFRSDHILEATAFYAAKAPASPKPLE